MAADNDDKLKEFMAGLKRRNPNETEFHQAVHEVAADVIPFLETNPLYQEHQVLERLTEPDRIITFRVCWEDDEGNVRVNRGYRVQNSNAIGPYKGGIRFHKSVTQSVLKFLAFEQTFKNSLTGLPMGGGKGGADFNPRGKSAREVMRFCQGFMQELSKHIGPNTDIPAGDIGVGGREVSYMFGEYKRLTNTFTGALTGKGLSFGGSLIRTESTGYGSFYFYQYMLERIGQSVEGKTVAISGSGNVAQYATEKAIELGAKVVTLSDSSGYIHVPNGITSDGLKFIMELKNKRRGRISEFAKKFGGTYHKGETPWNTPCDVAIPAATQNEIDGPDAAALIKNGCKAIVEAANMPCTPKAIDKFKAADTLFAPSKAANAGGVAVSGLEMTQNSMRLSWTRNAVDEKLQEIMRDIHDKCVEYGTEGEHVNYMKGANVAGFVKVADAVVAYGIL
jgi:glutamate dehydrogenase (NADP+)